MKNKFKDAYLKYLTYTGKYVVGYINGEPKGIINIETSPISFPHLVGKDFFPGGAAQPPQIFINKILAGEINNKNIDKLKSIDKDKASLMFKKLKIFSLLNDTNDIYMTKDPIKLIKNSPKKYYVLYKKLNNSNFGALALSKDKIGIYHPSSLMFINERSKKMKKILAETKFKIINFRQVNQQITIK